MKNKNGCFIEARLETPVANSMGLRNFHSPLLVKTFEVKGEKKMAKKTYVKPIPKSIMKEHLENILPTKKVGEVVIQTKQYNILMNTLSRATNELEEKLAAVLPIERKEIIDRSSSPTVSVTPQSIQLERLNYRLKDIIGRINAMKNTCEL
jgi:hypothetical protein